MNGNTTSINDISNQFGLWRLTENSNDSILNERQLETIRLMKHRKLKDIASAIGVHRSFLYQIRINEHHVNHKALVEIMGKPKKRKRHKPLRSQLKEQAVNLNPTPDELSSLAVGFLLEYIMTSDNSALNARDKDLARLYKSLREALRLSNKNEPLYEHSLALYNEVTKELINVTRKIYDEREETQSPEKSEDKKDS
jgi:hypothetical protein